MINFDTLPDDKPNTLPEIGTYYATIEKAEMKTNKDPSKPPYLNLTLAIQDKTGKSCGKVFDIISESDHDLIRYKIKRLIEALQLPITGNFELKDLTKIIENKKLLVDITIDDPKKKDPNSIYQPKAVVDLFSNAVYYPLSEATNIFGGEPYTEAIFNAPDADDAEAVNY